MKSLFKSKILVGLLVAMTLIAGMFMLTACGNNNTNEAVFVSTDAVKLAGVEFANSAEVKLTKTGENAYKVENYNASMTEEQVAVYGPSVRWVAIRVRMAGGSTYKQGWVAKASDAIDSAESLKTGSIAADKDVKPFVLGARLPNTQIWKIEVTTGTTNPTVVTYTVDFSNLFKA